ncbi:unnamed protein product, partial [Mesorhabditis belari]|uniref:Bifunctional lysine-specific demethylase and histidyl-hydroxylase n=1 Tax=Mesorhabditis belari TaxID=2138241 RepID=A0AAF3F3S3_9BILA
MVKRRVELDDAGDALKEKDSVKKRKVDEPLVETKKKKKRRNKKNQDKSKVLTNGSAPKVSPKKEKKIDPWVTIEAGTAKAAATLRVNGKGEDVKGINGSSEEKKQREQKKKKRRGCDGSEGNVDRPVQSFERKPKNTEDDDDILVLNASNTKRSREVIIEEVVDSQTDGVSIKKLSRKKSYTMEEGVDYIVEEPDDNIEGGKTPDSPKTNGDLYVSDEDSDYIESEDNEEDEEESDEEEAEIDRLPFYNGHIQVTGDDEDDEDEEASDQNEYLDNEAVEMIDYHESDEDEDEEEPSGESLDGESLVDEDIDDEDDVDFELEEEGEELEDEIVGEDSDAESVISGESLEVAFEHDRKAGQIDTRTNGKKGQEKEVPIDFSKLPFNTSDDSTVAATRALGWILSNCGVQSFFDEFWQQNALVVHRHNKNYYGNLLNVKEFGQVIAKEHVEYGKNINIAEYREGLRYTLNGQGRVYPRHLQNHLIEGRSIQLVNPQRFFPRIWYLCEILQELFGCFVGANTYLTPAGSSGFAPHWDEIDAFLLQLEGRKYWKVYAPDSVENELPRESSGNFTDKDFVGRQPCFEGWIEQGDMLYLPRGFIHQASTCKQTHSFHVTISVGRHHSFADMLEKLMPIALTQLGDKRVKLRQGLPPGYLDMTGIAELDYKNEEHEDEKLTIPMAGHMSALNRSVRQAVPFAVDFMAREFMKTALPPMLTPDERRLSAFGDVDILKGKRVIFSDQSEVRLIRRHAQRMIFESPESCFIVHRMTNSLDYEERPEQLFAFPFKLIDDFCQLQSAYPEWTKLGEIRTSKENKKGNKTVNKNVLELARLLYDNGLLMVKE